MDFVPRLTRFSQPYCSSLVWIHCFSHFTSICAFVLKEPFPMICLLLPQALDLGDTVTDVHVVRTVIERQQRLTHFRLCRCIAIENLLLNRILQQILTLEAQSEGINTNSPGPAVFGSTDGCLVMSDGLWCFVQFWMKLKSMADF